MNSLLASSRWLSRSLISVSTALAACACGSPPSSAPSSAIENVSRLIARYQPVAVFSNEAHSDDATRFLSACWFDAISQNTPVSVFAAEAFSFRSPITPDPYDHRRLDGSYHHNAHFRDMIHVAGENRAVLAGYDFSNAPLVGRSSLRQAGYVSSRWNVRERSGAIRLRALWEDSAGSGSMFVHVGLGHINRIPIQRAGGVETGVAGHFARLVNERVLSIDNAMSELSDFRVDRFFDCPDVVDFERYSVVVEFNADRFHCLAKDDFKPHRRAFDISVVDRPVLGVNGYVLDAGSLCPHRRTAVVEAPANIGLSQGQSLRLRIMQTDGIGRRIETWKEIFATPPADPMLIHPLATDNATVIWDLLDPDGLPQPVSDEEIEI